MPIRKIKNKSIIYRNSLVAFIDILGFKEIIKQSQNDESKLELLYNTLLFLKGRENGSAWTIDLVEIEEDAQKKGVDKFNISDDTYCSCFSDSIVISVRLKPDNINEATSTLISNLSFIGAELMTQGILFRGAITIGNIIHEDNGLVMGQGLIDAYQLETNLAKFPRVVISKELLAKLNYPITQKKDRYPYHQYLNRFDDGSVGFHQMIYYQVLQSWEEMPASKLKKELKMVKSTIIDGLDSSFEFPDIHYKYQWLQTQYERLIIHEIGLKEKIFCLNEGFSGHNIHYRYTDDRHFTER